MTTREIMYRPGCRTKVRDVAEMVAREGRARWVTLSYDKGRSRQVLDRYELAPGDGSVKKLTTELVAWIDQHLRAVANAPAGRWLTFTLNVTRCWRDGVKGITRRFEVRYGPPAHTLDFGGEE